MRHNKPQAIITTLSAALMLSMSLGHAEDVSAANWQAKMLLSPSGVQLAGERNGRVTIYDGLHESTVDQAMNTQFERIGSMMFVDTRYTAADGSEYADDDCED